jgi:hypothetical protein
MVMGTTQVPPGTHITHGLLRSPSPGLTPVARFTYPASVQITRQLVVDWAQIIGALVAVIAIWFAVRAQRDGTSARGEVVAERRRQFELETLRELLTAVDSGDLGDLEFNPERALLFRHRLALLPDDDLPFWRKVMNLEWRDEVVEAVGFTEALQAANVKHFEIAKRGPGDDPDRWEKDRKAAEADLHAVTLAFQQAFHGRLSRELLEAITTRVEAGRFEPSRRTWLGLRRRRAVGDVD